MSFFKKSPMASQHTSGNPAIGAGGAGVRATELSAHENANATLDLSNEARARRAAEEAAARNAANASSPSSSSSSSASAADICSVQQIPFNVPDGTDPHVTWSGIQSVNASGDIIHKDDGFIYRQKFVHEPAPFDRFDGVNKFGVAPATYTIDLPHIDDATRASLIEEMNTAMGAPSLNVIYDVDKLQQSQPTPRVWCEWPLSIVHAPTNEQLTRTLLSFQSPLPDSATPAELYAFCSNLPPSSEGAIPLGVAPGSIEKCNALQFSGPAAKFTDREYHGVPLSIKVIRAHNTTDVNFDLKLQVPNVRRASPEDGVFITQSEKIGIRSSGDFMYASSADACLNRVYLMRRTALYNSPEARRWAAVDRVTEKAKFLADADGNVSSTNVFNGQSEQVVNVMLCTKPKNLLQYIVVTYPDQLVAAALNSCVSRPIHNPSGAGIDEGNVYGRVAVPLKALEVVFDYYCDMYCPSNYAINEHKLQLLAVPTNSNVGLHTLRSLGERSGKPAQLEYVLEVIQVPYNGPQRISEGGKECLERVNRSHERVHKLAMTFTDALLSKVRGTATSASPVAATAAAGRAQVLTPPPTAPAAAASNADRLAILWGTQKRNK